MQTTNAACMCPQVRGPQLLLQGYMTTSLPKGVGLQHPYMQLTVFRATLQVGVLVHTCVPVSPRFPSQHHCLWRRVAALRSCIVNCLRCYLLHYRDQDWTASVCRELTAFWIVTHSNDQPTQGSAISFDWLMNWSCKGCALHEVRAMKCYLATLMTAFCTV
jgi:hypothetical protein